MCVCRLHVAPAVLGRGSQAGGGEHTAHITARQQHGHYRGGSICHAPLSTPHLHKTQPTPPHPTPPLVCPPPHTHPPRPTPFLLCMHTPQILSHEINHGYKLAMLPVETFNTTPVQNLAHLAHLVDSSDDPYLNFGLDGGRFITLDRQQVCLEAGCWAGPFLAVVMGLSFSPETETCGFRSGRNENHAACACAVCCAEKIRLRTGKAQAKSVCAVALCCCRWA